MTVQARELRMAHGRLHYIHLYMVDEKGNSNMWHSYPLMVDTTPPPIETLIWPRVYPDRWRNTSANRRDQYFVTQHRIQPSWNTVYEGQKDWEPLQDPESGDLETSFTIWQLDNARLIHLVGPIPAHGGYSSYIDTMLPGNLTLGAKYLMKIEFRNKAMLTATVYSEEVVADWTLPVVVRPRLHAGSEDPNDAVVGQWEYPPGGSVWGGIRSFAWVGEHISKVGVPLFQDGFVTCHDPESGVHQVEVFAGSKRDAWDHSPRKVVTGLENTTVEVGWNLGPHGTVHHLNVWCMNGAAQSLGANPASEIRIDRTPPTCHAGQAVIGEGVYRHVQADTSRLQISYFDRAWSDQETGIGRVEYELRDLTVNVTLALPQMAHAGLPPTVFIAEGLQLQHDHRYSVVSHAWNGVNGRGSPCESSTVLIDTSPPVPGTVYVVNQDRYAYVGEPHKTPLASRYQFSLQSIRITTRHFGDNESGVAEQYVRVTRSDGWIIAPERTVRASAPLAAFPVKLFHGQQFVVHWRAMNFAELSTIVESYLVTIDSSPPIISHVHDHLLGVDSEVEYVGLSDTVLLISFGATDPESGIERARWWIGSFPGAYDVLPPVPINHRSRAADAYVTGMADGAYYFASLEVYNNAGNWAFKTSNGFFVDLRAPYCGKTMDGPYYDRTYVGPARTPNFFYTSENRLKGYGEALVSWSDYRDYGSGIAGYAVAFVSLEDLTLALNETYAELGGNASAFVEVGLGQIAILPMGLYHNVIYTTVVSTWDRWATYYLLLYYLLLIPLLLTTAYCLLLLTT